MAQRTLAGMLTGRQQTRLETVFREELLKTPAEDGGAQRMVENEAMLRGTLRLLLPGMAEPYFQFISAEVEVTTNYSLDLVFQTDVFRTDSPQVRLSGLKKEPLTRLMMLIQENSNCPTDQTMVRTLRKAGWEYADAWDLRAFVAKSPEIPDTHTGRTIYAPATQVPVPSGKEPYPAIAHLDRVVGKWGLGLSRSLNGPSLVRRIEKA